MKIQGQHTFNAPRQVVWDAVMDPDVIARIMPGCEALETVGENAYEGAMKIKIGPVQGKFKGSVELSELEEPSSYRLKMKGKGAPGFVEADGRLELSEADGTTTLDYEVTAKIGGRMASVGQRLLESSTKVIARQSLEGLEAQVDAIHNPAPDAAEAEDGDELEETGATDEPAATDDATANAASDTSSDTAEPVRARPRPAAPPPPSQAEFATRFARGMLEEMVPTERLPQALGLAAAAGFVVGFALGRLLGR